jgi:hypothetical protein
VGVMRKFSGIRWMGVLLAEVLQWVNLYPQALSVPDAINICKRNAKVAASREGYGFGISAGRLTLPTFASSMLI